MERFDLLIVGAGAAGMAAALGAANGYIEETVAGQKVVKVFNHEADCVEEFNLLNDDMRDTQFKAVFTLPYQPGTLRAEAGGETVTLATAGAPTRLRLTADRRTTEADGQSLAFIIVEVVDKEGRVCPEAAISCDVVVSGQGTLMAAASADLKDREPYTTPHVTTWKGRAIIVVRSTQRKGQMNVKVKSQLPTASMTLRNQ